ncbi:MAG TPA: hypothetical protein VEW42_01450 [Candidatus Eisenbacteria bacterium]|nr:hypothetical protein [Candidatus Eisenbacteria bacterium]
MTKAKNKRVLASGYLRRLGVTDKEMKSVVAADPELYLGKTTMILRPKSFQETSRSESGS